MKKMSGYNRNQAEEEMNFHTKSMKISTCFPEHMQRQACLVEPIPLFLNGSTNCALLRKLHPKLQVFSCKTFLLQEKGWMNYNRTIKNDRGT